MSTHLLTLRWVFSHPVLMLAFGFGAGLAPLAPGTVATLAAIPIYFIMVSLSWPVYAAVILAMAILGIGVCGYAARRMGVHDHPSIVWDEIVGFLITMWGAPIGLTWVLLGFVLFRLFDILKPWPIALADRRVHGGLGIMLDDLLAGVFALACMQLIARSGV